MATPRAPLSAPTALAASSRGEITSAEPVHSASSEASPAAPAGSPVAPAASPVAAASPLPWGARLRGLMRDAVAIYATADPRTLGLFRICLGMLLMYDVLRRVPDAGVFYSNDGFISNHSG